MANYKKQFCPKGHNTFVAGRLGGGCVICRRDASRRRTIEHPVEVHAAIKKWTDANKDHIKDMEYRRTYGITLDDYKTRVSTQEGRCLICKEQKDLVVDHCHRTGAVRGLLCSTCNRAMGLFQDNPVLLSSAVSYLS